MPPIDYHYSTVVVEFRGTKDELGLKTIDGITWKKSSRTMANALRHNKLRRYINANLFIYSIAALAALSVAVIGFGSGKFTLGYGSSIFFLGFMGMVATIYLDKRRKLI